ncbi:MAG: division plane positioning ATPase MipZ [Pseudomonadota bacterium]
MGVTLEALAGQAGFRVGPSLRESVTYRDVFPYGLTVADTSARLRPSDISAPRRAVREELRALIAGLGFGGFQPGTMLDRQPA